MTAAELIQALGRFTADVDVIVQIDAPDGKTHLFKIDRVDGEPVETLQLTAVPVLALGEELQKLDWS